MSIWQWDRDVSGVINFHPFILRDKHHQRLIFVVAIRITMPTTASPTPRSKIEDSPPDRVDETTVAVGCGAARVGVRVGVAVGVGGTGEAVAVAVAGPGVGVAVAGGVTCKISISLGWITEESLSPFHAIKSLT